MRKIIKFFDIILISLALFVFILSNILSNFILNKNYIKNLLSENKVYTNINDEIKKSVKTDLKVSLSDIPNLDINDLVDKTITEDILEEELDYILTTLYDTNQMKVDLSILSKGYTTNLDNYINDNNIKVPEQIKKEINNTMSNNSLKEEDVTYFNENYSKYFGKAKSLLKKIRLYSLISLVTLVGLTLLLAKKKFNGLYISALLNSAGIFSIGIVLKSFIDTQDIKIGDKKLDGIVTSIKNSIFDSFNKWAIILLIVAVALIIISIICKIIMSSKTKKQVTSIDDKIDEQNSGIGETQVKEESAIENQEEIINNIDNDASTNNQEEQSYNINK